MLLLTGQEPPEGYDASPSAELVRRLDGEQVGGHAIRSEVLPRHADAAAERVVEAIEEEPPTVLLATGFEPGSSAVAVERLGIRMGEWLAAPDDDSDATDVDHPVGYFATVPSGTVVGELRQRGVPARLSTAAGSAFCDAILYEVLAHVGRESLPTTAGFLTLPCLPSQAVRRVAGGHPGADLPPSMDAETQLEALVSALTTAIQAR